MEPDILEMRRKEKTILFKQLIVHGDLDGIKQTHTSKAFSSTFIAEALKHEL